MLATALPISRQVSCAGVNQSLINQNCTNKDKRTLATITVSINLLLKHEHF